ncbi:dTDP-glucose 4,6-dehydratase [Kineococcus gynurae]|uniref:dTDP-glucose 4,6-dehydratase n=1 Tax=Kineococcus gynurae TaxID=452979 RepID=A0ABV5LWN3_9ACTN
MRLLVTGGAGFIGSHYVRSVLDSSIGTAEVDSLTVLDALTYAGNRANLDPVADDPRLRFVQGDICEPGDVEPLVAEADVVVHFAAESHVDRSIAGAGGFVTTNVLGTQVLLDSALRQGVSKFVHVSTDEVYGSIDEGSWTEDRPLEPNSPYSASKASSDLLARAFHRTHGLPVCITRCSNNYGPYQFPEKVMPLFITSLMQGGTVPLYGDGGNIRDWLHVDDHCRGIQLVVEGGRPGEIYNIGGGTELTNKELTAKILEAFGVGWERVRPVEDRKGHDRRYSVDIGKISAELGYAPRHTFEEGLAETITWYRENESWWRPLLQRAALA